MRNIIVLFIGISISFPLWAENEKPTYTQEMQKLFNEKSAEAKTQFNNTYPQPTAPKIPNSVESLPVTPTEPQQPQNYQAAKPFAAPKSYSYQQQPPNQTPTTTENKKDQNSTSYNIYSPSNPNNNNTSGSTQNMYR